LYYTVNPRDQSLQACSELGRLVATLEGVRLNIERLGASLLDCSLKDSTQTHYQGIQQVPAGDALTVSPSGVRGRVRIPFDVRPQRTTSKRDLGEELRRHLLAAVARAIGDAQVVGVSVSGGIDSSGLLALAATVARSSSRRVLAFSIPVVPFRARDDRPHLRAVCEALGIEPVFLKPMDCRDALLKTFVLDLAPATWPSATLQVSISRLARERGAERILTGIGGDIVFGGDDSLFANRVRQGHALSALRLLARLKGSGLAAYGRIVELLIKPLLRGLAPRAMAESWAQPRCPEWAGRRLRRVLDAGVLGSADQIERNHRPRDRSYLASLAASAIFEASSESRSQAEVAAECTMFDPYLDDDLVRFLSSLEPEALFHNGWERGLYREALRGLIPDSVAWRPNKGGIIPAVYEVVMTSGGFAALEPLVQARGLADLGLVEPRAFRKRFDLLTRAPLRGDLWSEVWPVLAGEAFVQSQHGQRPDGC
jgi:asparagine synthase (glutamine-hydrolysing)